MNLIKRSLQFSNNIIYLYTRTLNISCVKKITDFNYKKKKLGRLGHYWAPGLATNIKGNHGRNFSSQGFDLIQHF